MSSNNKQNAAELCCCVVADYHRVARLQFYVWDNQINYFCCSVLSTAPFCECRCWRWAIHGKRKRGRRSESVSGGCKCSPSSTSGWLVIKMWSSSDCQSNWISIEMTTIRLNWLTQSQLIASSASLRTPLFLIIENSRGSSWQKTWRDVITIYDSRSQRISSSCWHFRRYFWSLLVIILASTKKATLGPLAEGVCQLDGSLATNAPRDSVLQAKMFRRPLWGASSE